MNRGPLVVDTNVLVAGLLTHEPGSPTAILVDRMLRGELRFLLSETLLAEYRAVLLRPKVARAHGLSAEEVDEILIRLATNGAMRDPPSPDADSALRVRDDQHLFDLLDLEPAARLVSGDAEALRRAGDRGLTPRASLEQGGTR